METVLTDYGIMILLLMGWVFLTAVGGAVAGKAQALPGAVAVSPADQRGWLGAMPPGSGRAPRDETCLGLLERRSLKRCFRFPG